MVKLTHAACAVGWLASRLGLAGPRPKGHLDGISGSTATGWAAAPDGRALEVELLLDGDVIASAPANRYREDIATAGFGDGFAGFSMELPVRPRPGETFLISARLKQTGRILGGSPVEYSFPAIVSEWLQRRERLTGPLLERFRRRADAALGGRRISIVMPVYNTRDDWLRAAIQSVRDQWCSAWQLVCVDDASTLPSVRETLLQFSALDPRIKVVSLHRNGGIARATNRGIAESDGNYIGFLDHDDYLEPDAVYRTLMAATDGSDLIYSDELVTGQDLDNIVGIVSRPAFSYDYYISHPYFVHFIAVRRALAMELGGWAEEMKISADVDFVLRVLERALSVTHIPLPLYRWRTHDSSAGHTLKGEVTKATVGALDRHFKRLGIAARAAPGLSFNHYRADFEDDHGRVAIVIPTRDRVDLLRDCIASIERSTQADIKIIVIDNQSSDPETVAFLAEIADRHTVIAYERPFNFAAMNNDAVRRAAADCKYLVFMNNDVEAIEPGWVERLRSLAARIDVGLVGATLIYPDSTVQHAGVILGLGPAADHSHRSYPLLNGGVRNPGFNGSLISVRDYTAVTAACMMMRAEIFRAFGGFDEDLVVGFNDTDLCLRVGAAGYKILNDGNTVLIHKESATRSGSNAMKHPKDTSRFIERWRDDIVKGDPFYNPGLSVHGTNHQLSTSCTKKISHRTRNVVLPNRAIGAGNRCPHA